MKLANIMLERFRDIDTNSKGKLYSHQLTEQLNIARSFAARVNRDGIDIVYVFADNSRLRVNNPMQLTDKATFTVLSSVG